MPRAAHTARAWNRDWFLVAGDVVALFGSREGRARGLGCPFRSGPERLLPPKAAGLRRDAKERRRAHGRRTNVVQRRSARVLMRHALELPVARRHQGPSPRKGHPSPRKAPDSVTFDETRRAERLEAKVGEELECDAVRPAEADLVALVAEGELPGHVGGAPLDVPIDRIYIDFADAVGAMWGWNGETFG